jgi:tRNA pseudouridine38-40 synthase
MTDEQLQQQTRNPIPETRRVAFIVSYDGSEWSGSQRQNNSPSVQGELERALGIVLKHEITVVLAGRTDAGVHATGQVGMFATANRIPAERVAMALNRVLEPSVRVRESRDLTDEELAQRWHPRFSATSRTYRYWIDNAPCANPLLRKVAGHVRSQLDLELMRAATKPFIGERDFAAWQSAGSNLRGTVREVKRVEVRETQALGSSLIEVEIEANAFLYGMARNIVGALVEAGRGDIGPEEIERMTLGLDRKQCPPPAPPQGLCLTQVKY